MVDSKENEKFDLVVEGLKNAISRRLSLIVTLT